MKLDFSEQFPQLAHAPIVEAVIDFRAKPTVPCEQAAFEAYFKNEFKDFPTFQIQNQLNYHINTATAGQTEPTQAISSWQGLIFQSTDKLRIAQCQKDGFAFSRLAPYEQWDSFVGEALSLWRKYVHLTKPLEIQRMGVRFINRIVIKPEWLRLRDYLTDAPESLAGMEIPLVRFMQGNTFLAPDHNYLINLNLVFQPTDGATPTPAIIVDTDVSTTQALNFAENKLDAKLKEMRWLKNKFFFASLTPKLIESLK